MGCLVWQSSRDCARGALWRSFMETEEERLRNDSFARDRMMQHMQAVEEAEARGETGDRGAWKWAIRKRIWDYMEENGVAANPRPVHHRIPNFVGSELTARQVEQLPEFKRAKWVKVNPDTPQKSVREAVLRHGKILLVPQPRLRTGFFSILNPGKIPPQKIQYAVTQAGVADFGEPISLDADIKVDMVVIGSVAVNPTNGARLGKGEGFAELEYGMLRMMGAIDDATPVVTCIHECSLVDDIPTEKMLSHDVPVDIVCTPTRIIRLSGGLPKPTGIYWDRLSPQKLASIRILQVLKAKIERETGTVLPEGPAEVLPPTAMRGKKGGKSGKGRGKGKEGYGGTDSAGAAQRQGERENQREVQTGRSPRWRRAGQGEDGGQGTGSAEAAPEGPVRAVHLRDEGSRGAAGGKGERAQRRWVPKRPAEES